VHEWLPQLQELWSDKAVQAGKANVNVDSLHLSTSPFSLRRRKKASLEDTIERLEQLPSFRSEKLQRQISSLVPLIMPFADAEQLRRLESAASLETANLYAAAEEDDFMALALAPLSAWTENLVRGCSAKLSREQLTGLACKWASAQEADTCLRENDALSWLLQVKIPRVDTALPLDAFIRACCAAWLALPRSTLSLLSAIQTCLPLQRVGSIPTVLHTAFFRVWIPLHPERKAIMAALLKRKYAPLLQEASARLLNI